jgi:hypothetical protein
MKLFTRHLAGLKLSRATARTYAFYRRNSLIPAECTLEKLVQFHVFESTGKGDSEQIRASNGWANGKWAAKVTLESILQDLQAGYVCKYEFYTGASGWWFRKQLANIVTTKPFFPFER